jgi:hypothetical protein
MCNNRLVAHDSYREEPAVVVRKGHVQDESTCDHADTGDQTATQSLKYAGGGISRLDLAMMNLGIDHNVGLPWQDVAKRQPQSESNGERHFAGWQPERHSMMRQASSETESTVLSHSSVSSSSLASTLGHEQTISPALETAPLSSLGQAPFRSLKRDVGATLCRSRTFTCLQTLSSAGLLESVTSYGSMCDDEVVVQESTPRPGTRVALLENYASLDECCSSHLRHHGSSCTMADSVASGEGHYGHYFYGDDDGDVEFSARCEMEVDCSEHHAQGWGFYLGDGADMEYQNGYGL